MLGRAFNVVVQCLVVRGFNDTQCGFKCFRGDAADTLFGLQRTMGWTFDVEILYLARKKAMRVVELPIECHYDDTSKMRTLPAALTVLRDILSRCGGARSSASTPVMTAAHLTTATVSGLDRRPGPRENAADSASHKSALFFGRILPVGPLRYHV